MLLEKRLPSPTRGKQALQETHSLTDRPLCGANHATNGRLRQAVFLSNP
ncbi:MAG: hypothetical protein HF973_11095 [Chloroflexi bacterium]|nr:hypothetical protein [Chloroflexota bacterium]